MARTVRNLIVEHIDTPHVHVEFSRGDKLITAYDKDDRNNEPAAFTKRKRGLDKIWAALLECQTAFGDKLTFRDVTACFTQHGMPYHYWCRMD